MNEVSEAPVDIPEKSKEDVKPSKVTITWEPVYDDSRNEPRVTAMRAPVPGGWLVRPSMFSSGICFMPDHHGAWVADPQEDEEA